MSIHDLSRQSLITNAAQHLDGAPDFETVFSSRSQSLTLALSLARQHPDGHLSVIGTKRLGEENVVIHTPLMQKMISSTLREFSYEFLAFVTISGDAHRAVPVSELVKKAAIVCVMCTTVWGGRQSTEPNQSLMRQYKWRKTSETYLATTSDCR